MAPLIPVGTGETCIDAYPMDASAILGDEVFTIPPPELLHQRITTIREMVPRVLKPSFTITSPRGA